MLMIVANYLAHLVAVGQITALEAASTLSRVLPFIKEV